MLTGVIVLMIVVDLFAGRDAKGALSSLAGIGLLGAAIPLITLAVNGADRSMFGGAFVVDHFALALDAVFVIAGYVVVLLSTNYIAEGDYWEGEYYILILWSVLGMMVMASAARPDHHLRGPGAVVGAGLHAGRLAQARPAQQRGRPQVLPDGRVRLGRDALRHVADLRLHRLDRAGEIGHQVNHLGSSKPIVSLAIVFMIIGFAFKVSAVPFHTWAPDTYEGAPTPVAAFLATASKTAGFVALWSSSSWASSGATTSTSR